MPYIRARSSLPLVFNTRDEELHKRLKSPIAPLFSLSSVLTFEKSIDQMLAILFNELDKRYARPRQICNLGDWLQFFAFEVMGAITFSKTYGFLEQGRDENGMLGALWDFSKKTAPVSPRYSLTGTIMKALQRLKHLERIC